MAKNTLGGKAIRKREIEVYGVSGSFTISPREDQPTYKVRYFNTVASSNPNSKAGNSKDLLSELKPMRERTSAAKLNDLSTLLQRELNDYRVAHELIPYLQGKNTEVGFFPGILVALVPKQFLETEAEGVAYPSPKSGDDANSVHYGDFWSVQEFEVEGQPTALGLLKINHDETDLIVLDGQHRANAFRYVAGTFEDAEGDTIYAPFYQACEQPETFDSELPVTIVWFEAEGTEVSPILISRRLFVDVNTNARPVSVSRNILLDDTNLASIATTAFYSVIAQQGFEAKRLSLLHSGFDAEEQNTPRHAIFTPAHVKYAFSYLMFGRDEYDALNKVIKKDAVGDQGTLTRFKRFAACLKDEVIQNTQRGDHYAWHSLNDCLVHEVAPMLVNVFEEFSFLRPHYRATEQLQEYINSEADHIEQEVWHKVFCGGEGLYASFSDVPEEGKAKKYKSAISSIEKRFDELRVGEYGTDKSEVDAAYRVFRTKAMLTGMLMALSKFVEQEGWTVERVSAFIAAVNDLSPGEWVKVFSEIKPAVVKNLDPKSWPQMRNIVLRVIQSRTDENYFTAVNISSSPDGYILSNAMKEKKEAWVGVNLRGEEYEEPAKELQEKWVKEAVEALEGTFAAAGIGLIYEVEEMKEFAQTELARCIDDARTAYEKRYGEVESG